MGGSGAPGGSSMVQVLGRARPRVHAVAALEHLTAWLEQQSMSVSGLAELAGPEPEASTNRLAVEPPGLEIQELRSGFPSTALFAIRWAHMAFHWVGVHRP